MTCYKILSHTHTYVPFTIGHSIILYMLYKLLLHIVDLKLLDLLHIPNILFESLKYKF